VRKAWPSPIAGKYESWWLTTNISIIWQGLLDWNWTSVLKKANWLCLLYMCVTVLVSKTVYILLSELNLFLAGEEVCTPDGMEKTGGQALGIVILIFVAVGISLFLLPPVPGVPVYILGGVVLVNKMWDGVTEGSFWFAIWVTSVIGLALKLTACTIQQKVFGEQLGKLVSVRSMIGVNSDFTRCIGMILSQPGITLGKVTVLCGGPDWPVSVTCGILKQNLASILCGTLPVYFLIVPCVLSGAFMLRVGGSTGAITECQDAMAAQEAAGEEDSAAGLYQTMSEITIFLTFMLQNGAVMMAVGAVTSIVQENARLRNQKYDNDSLIEWSANWKTWDDKKKLEILSDQKTNAYDVLRRYRIKQINKLERTSVAEATDIQGDLVNITDAIDCQFFDVIKKKVKDHCIRLENPDIMHNTLRRDQFMEIYSDYKFIKPKLVSIGSCDKPTAVPEALRRDMQLRTRKPCVTSGELRQGVLDTLDEVQIKLQRVEDRKQLDSAILEIADEITGKMDTDQIEGLKAENDEIVRKLPDDTIDEEVAKLERDSEALKNTGLRVEANQSKRVFGILFASWLLHCGACLMVGFAGGMAFRSFGLTNKVSDPYELDGLNKNPLNLVVVPFGLVVLGMYFFGYFLWQCWHWVIKHQVSAATKELNVEEETARALETGEAAASEPAVDDENSRENLPEGGGQ